MSTHAFSPKQGPVSISAELTGPNGTTKLNLALDTGATMTVIKATTLQYLGFDLNQPIRRTRMTTGSAIGVVPIFALTRISAMGQHRFVFPVIGDALATIAGFDGLLGLDFLRDPVLTIDFRQGQISLT